MNTIPAQEIKRRGISAVDALLEHGPVHVIAQNRPRYVVMDEECYQALREAEEERIFERWQEVKRAEAEGRLAELSSETEIRAWFEALTPDDGA